MPEGRPIFPGEPIVTVRGPVIQAQFVETMILLCVNHQSLIATKANRIVRAAQGRAVMEFGSRRAQGADGAVMGSRAAYIGGCVGTACTLSDRDFKIPALGTMAHSWVQLFDSELEAFRAYAKAYPTNCLLLVDTYNVLKSGVPNAIRVFDEVLKPLGMRPAGIRIDSGDITYLSCKARKNAGRSRISRLQKSALPTPWMNISSGYDYAGRPGGYLWRGRTADYGLLRACDGRGIQAFRYRTPRRNRDPENQNQ